MKPKRMVCRVYRINIDKDYDKTEANKKILDEVDYQLEVLEHDKITISISEDQIIIQGHKDQSDE